MLWENLREEEFAGAVEASKGLCVLPIGCIEKHGQHLPIGTDYLHAAAIARLAAEKEPCVVFPTLLSGEKTGAGEFNGTVIYSAELRLMILKETCHEIARNGFKKILLLNGHGGNTAMLQFFTRSVLYDKDPGFMIFTAGIGLPKAEKILEKNYPYLTAEDKAIWQEYIDTGRSKKGGHGDFVETGMTYGTDPETVRLDRMDAESGLSTHLFDPFTALGIQTHFAWMGNYPNSYTSDYQPGMNERIARSIVDCAVEEAAEKFAFLKNETISDAYFEDWKKKQK